MTVGELIKKLAGYDLDRSKAYAWAKKMEKKGYSINSTSFSEKMLNDPLRNKYRNRSDNS